MKQRIIPLLVVISLVLSLLSGCTTTGKVTISNDIITSSDAIDMTISLQGYYLTPTNLTLKFITEEYLYVTRADETEELKTDEIEGLKLDSRKLEYKIRTKNYYGSKPVFENVVIIVYDKNNVQTSKLSSDFIEVRRR